MEHRAPPRQNAGHAPRGHTASAHMGNAGHPGASRTGSGGVSRSHSSGGHGSGGSALGRHMARNPNGIATQRHAKTSTTPHGSSPAGSRPGNRKGQAGSALSRYVAGNPNSLAAHRHAATSQRHGAQPSQQFRKLPGDLPAGNDTVAQGARVRGQAGQRGRFPSSSGPRGGPRRQPWLYPAFGGGPHGYPVDTADTASDQSTVDGTPADTGLDAAGTAASRASSAAGPLSIGWQEPTDMATAIGQPGGGVFIVERAGDNDAWLPTLVGAAPEGFGRRLEYVAEDVSEQDGVRVRLGILPTRPNHPADRAVLRAIAHDIVARVHDSGSDSALTNQSGLTERDRRLLQQRGIENGGEVPDYLSGR
jgi:hypothetical protein